jgi:hypothetical protein
MTLGTEHLYPRELHEEDLEGGLLYWGTPKDMLKRYIKRDVKMPCKRVSLSIGAPLGNLEVISLPGLFERKG